jgi:hypothetical protein
MKLLLRWSVTQAIGIAAAFLLGIRDTYRDTHNIEFEWGSLIYYSDRLTWIGLTTAGFVMFDFARRASDSKEQSTCTGAVFAWLVSFSSILVIIFAASYGMILMADAPTIVQRVDLPLVKGYGMVLIAGIFISLVYVVGVEVLTARKAQD